MIWIYLRGLFSQSAVIGWLIFLLTLVVTYLLWVNERENALQRAHIRFDISASDITQDIQTRMIAYENTLLSGAALMNTVEDIDRTQWNRYINSLNIAKHYPGFQGIGYSKVLRTDERNAFIRKMKQEGFLDYTIKPEGIRDEYHAIMYLEPLEVRNQRAIGYDMFSNDVRREAMIRARNSGQAALSGKVTLVQETDTDIQAGFLMYVPHYRSDNIPPLSQRKEMLDGFVYAPFRAGDMMTETLSHRNPDIAVRVYDGSEIDEANLLYESTPLTKEKPLFEQIVPLNLYGRTWIIVYQTLPRFNATVDYQQARFIVITGIPIAVLLLLIFLSYSQTTEQANRMANRMITEIKALNEELETMITAVPSPIILHTEDGIIVKINQAWTDATGYTHEEIPTIDVLVEKFYRDEKLRAEVQKHIRSLYEIIGKVDEGEFSFYNKSGKKMTWQFSSAPFGLLKGQRAVITSAMDITELKNKDELMLIQSRHAAMGEMISMIAHQWRQPLASISTIAGTLSMDTMMDEFNKQYFMERLDTISDLSMDLSATINDFRSFFKIDKTKEQSRWRELVEASLLIINPIIKSKNIALSIEYGDEVEFMTYPREMKQVILNLLKNAEDILVDKQIVEPKIWIRTFTDDNSVFLEVEDNAGGIAEDLIKKIFDPYFSTKMDKDGTGIGLYMSKTIVEDHNNGSLSVRNTAEGACFKIQLPKNSEEV